MELRRRRRRRRSDIKTTGALSLQPFVPSGPDYDASRRLFADLGFVEEWENDGYAGFRSGNATFILQRFDDATFASNFTVKIVVADLDAWWQETSAKRLDEKYAGSASSRRRSS